ncbi:histidine phosphatase family protein [Moraxella nasicaprae]|uniref:Histidine phosphatase family protein n=1 Tax=Moraxella nasicaprae TaxID=2904122 RepID=A0ABY6F3G6_9GAMM|nr:histidine phosphatase family protein [Moraxella nasicaprae]UXZ04620.1 histidine phosphatase family protein [Moraxella nasicaprae]
MQKTLYFVRHCEPNYDNHNDKERELTAKGQADTRLINDFFTEINIDGIYASTFKRAYDTVYPLAQDKGLSVIQMAEFCERKIDDGWIEDFDIFCQRQWQDFDYRLNNGESLRQVQNRYLKAVHCLLNNDKKTLVIGSHGTALSVLIAYYQKQFGYDNFCQIKSLFPFIVQFDFDGLKCQRIVFYDIISNNQYVLKSS